MKTYQTTSEKNRHNKLIFNCLQFIRWLILGAALLWSESAGWLQAQTNPSPATLVISGTGTNVNVNWNTGGTYWRRHCSRPVVHGFSRGHGFEQHHRRSQRVGAFLPRGERRHGWHAGRRAAKQLVIAAQNSGATIQLLSSPVATGNTRLVLTVAPGSISSTNIITILFNGELTVLRDDGQFPDQTAHDGKFSAVINVDTAMFDALNAEIAQLPANAQISYVYSGRAIVGTNALQQFPKANFLAGQLIQLAAGGGNDAAFVPGGNKPPGGVVAEPDTSPGGGTNNACAGSPLAYDPFKTEMIVDTSVVQDPTRTWDPLTGSIPILGHEDGESGPSAT